MRACHAIFWRVIRKSGAGTRVVTSQLSLTWDVYAAFSEQQQQAFAMDDSSSPSSSDSGSGSNDSGSESPKSPNRGASARPQVGGKEPRGKDLYWMVVEGNALFPVVHDNSAVLMPTYLLPLH